MTVMIENPSPATVGHAVEKRLVVGVSTPAYE